MSRKQVWMCGACGKTGATRMTVGDESCYLHSVLVWEDSIKRVDGHLYADAVTDAVKDLVKENSDAK